MGPYVLGRFRWLLPVRSVSFGVPTSSGVCHPDLSMRAQLSEKRLHIAQLYVH